VAASGGPLRPFTRLDSVSREGIQTRPVVLGEHGLVLYASIRLGTLNSRLGVARLDGTSKIIDLPLDHVLGFVLGHVVYLRGDGALMAVPFDVRALNVTGPSIPLISGLQNNAALSPTGTLLYVLGTASSQVMSVDERGASTTLLGERARYAHPRLSPDGRRLAIDITRDETTDIWTYDIATGTPTRLTTMSNNDRPEWSSDGKTLIYLSTRESDDYAAWSQPADGSHAGASLLQGPNGIREAMFTPDGRAIIFSKIIPTASATSE